MIQPIRKFFRVGCSFFHSLFPLQRFFLERFKSGQHFFQPVIGEARCFLRLIDLIAPVLALIFIEQIIVIFPCPLVKLSLVLERLLLPALVAAQLILLAFRKEDTPADFTFSEAQPPIVQPGQIISYQRIEGRIGADALRHALIVREPEIKPGIFGRCRAEHTVGNGKGLRPARVAVKLQRASLLERHREMAHFLHEAVTDFVPEVSGGAKGAGRKNPAASRSDGSRRTDSGRR